MTSLLVDPAPYAVADEAGALAARADFPLLAADPALVYLDSAATAQKPAWCSMRCAATTRRRTPIRTAAPTG
jgi:selenocysteine lyase/cysteine desulfurase